MNEFVKVGGDAIAEPPVFASCHKVMGRIQHGCHASCKITYLQVESRHPANARMLLGAGLA
jgi:hypothetical protein